MDKEHVKGAVDDVKGKIKEKVGHTSGNARLETEGQVEQVKGRAHKAAGDAKDAGKEAIDSIKHASSRR